MSKSCIVPQCSNSSLKTPEKLFVTVPKPPKRRKLWLRMARRNPITISSQSIIFMCEDHFNMEKDTLNYMQYKMGYSKNLLLTDKAMPTKFFCHEDRKSRMVNTEMSRTAFLKRERIDILQNCIKSEQAKVPDPFEEDKMEIVEPDHDAKTHDKATSTEPVITNDKGTQKKLQKNHYRSKAVQTILQNKEIATPWTPIKIKPCFLQPSQSSSRVDIEVNMQDDANSDGDFSRFDTLPSCQGSTMVTDSDCYDNSEIVARQLSFENTMRLIKKDPLMYVGIPKDSYFLIDKMHKHTNRKVDHILLCLKKIRLNRTFRELGYDFGISLSFASKLFLTNVPFIASFLKQFFVTLDQKLIKNNNYQNVTCLIDFLEIQIQKPSMALDQAKTWSENKKANTVKYLISCTPNGLVNFVSHGFGGRTSNLTIVENSDFLKRLEPGSVILANRGFKNFEQILNEKGIKLFRPPSVSDNEKLTKAPVQQTKVIASLRIHVKRVIRRVREFHMLMQHSMINNNILRVLDQVVIIACALINIQDSLIINS